MTEQHPTRFENYPPEGSSATPFLADPTPQAPPPPLVAPYVLSSAVPPPRRSRRGLLGAVLVIAIGVPLAGAVGFASHPEPGGTSTQWPDPEGSDTTELSIGSYTVPVPTDWNYEEGDDQVVLANGPNQITVAVRTPEPDDPSAVKEIASLVKGAKTGFSGKLGKPVDSSTDNRDVATLTGTGTFQGKPARLTAELWLDDDQQYLLIVSVLTAAEGSQIAKDATAVSWALTDGLR